MDGSVFLFPDVVSVNAVIVPVLLRATHRLAAELAGDHLVGTRLPRFQPLLRHLLFPFDGTRRIG